MLSISFWPTSADIVFHFFTSLFHNSCISLAGVIFSTYFWSWDLRWNQRCSRGLMSLSSNYCCAFLEMCFGPLSCWKVYLFSGIQLFKAFHHSLIYNLIELINVHIFLDLYKLSNLIPIHTAPYYKIIYTSILDSWYSYIDLSIRSNVVNLGFIWSQQPFLILYAQLSSTYQCLKHSYRNLVILLDSSEIGLEFTGITGIWNCHIYRYVLVARSSALKSNLYTSWHSLIS